MRKIYQYLANHLVHLWCIWINPDGKIYWWIFAWLFLLTLQTVHKDQHRRYYQSTAKVKESVLPQFLLMRSQDYLTISFSIFFFFSILVLLSSYNLAFYSFIIITGLLFLIIFVREESGGATCIDHKLPPRTEHFTYQLLLALKCTTA